MLLQEVRWSWIEEIYKKIIGPDQILTVIYLAISFRSQQLNIWDSLRIDDSYPRVRLCEIHVRAVD